MLNFKLAEAFVQFGTRGTKTVDRALDGVKARLTDTMQLASRLQGALAAAFGGVGLYAFAAGLRNTANELDGVYKAARRFDTSVQDVLRLKFAADLADVSFQQLSIALKESQISFADAVDPASRVSKILQAIGVTNLRTADGQLRSLVDLLPELADAFQQLPNEMRVKVAAELFGARSGPQMLSAMTDGADGLRTAFAEADATGYSALSKAAAVSERMNDSFTRVAKAATTVRGRIIEAIGPTISEMNERFAASVSSSAEAIAAPISRLMDWANANRALIGTLAKVATGIGAVLLGLIALKVAMVAVGVAMALVLSPLAIILSSVALAVGSFYALRVEGVTAADTIAAAWGSLQESLAAWSTWVIAWAGVVLAAFASIAEGTRLLVGEVVVYWTDAFADLKWGIESLYVTAINWAGRAADVILAKADDMWKAISTTFTFWMNSLNDRIGAGLFGEPEGLRNGDGKAGRDMAVAVARLPSRNVNTGGLDMPLPPRPAPAPRDKVDKAQKEFDAVWAKVLEGLTKLINPPRPAPNLATSPNKTPLSPSMLAALTGALYGPSKPAFKFDADQFNAPMEYARNLQKLALGTEGGSVAQRTLNQSVQQTAALKGIQADVKAGLRDIEGKLNGVNTVGD